MGCHAPAIPMNDDSTKIPYIREWSGKQETIAPNTLSTSWIRVLHCQTLWFGLLCHPNLKIACCNVLSHILRWDNWTLGLIDDTAVLIFFTKLYQRSGNHYQPMRGHTLMWPWSVAIIGKLLTSLEAADPAGCADWEVWVLGICPPNILEVE